MNDGEIVGVASAAGDPLLIAGHLSGSGRVRGDVVIAGTFSPGHSPAEVELENLILTSTATLVIEVGGTAPGTEFDVLRVTNQATLAGTLEVQLINGFEPMLADEFEFLTAATIVSTFDTLDFPTLGSDVALSLQEDPNALTLVTVMAPQVPALPSPWSAAALVVALAALGAAFQRTLRSRSAR